MTVKSASTVPSPPCGSPPGAGPACPCCCALAASAYIISAILCAAWLRLLMADSMASASSPFTVSLSLAMADSMFDFSSAPILSP